jgi:hypothetical protein
MKSVSKTVLLGAALANFLLPATAQNTNSPRVDQREQNQQQRIGEGVENGSLTAGEASRLERKEAVINSEENRMKADGSLTPRERARLTHQQNVMSRRIYAQKHDAQRQNTSPKTEIGQRKENQQKRIGEGIENGSLTAGEAARLEHKEAALNRETRRMRAENGGTLTPATVSLFLVNQATEGVVVTPNKPTSTPTEQIPAAKAASNMAPLRRVSRPTRIRGCSLSRNRRAAPHRPN